MNKMLKSALKYKHDYGFSIIPVKQDKRPYMKWEQYQKEVASDSEIEGWFKKWPDANIALVTGKVSGNICAIDIDTEEGEEAMQDILPDTALCPISHTPRGGKHLFFKIPQGQDLRNKAGEIKGTDFRGEGGYILLPPSQNGNGRQYKWDEKCTIRKIALSLLPIAYINRVFKDCKNHAIDVTNSYKSVTPVTMFQDGTRDNDIFHVANCLVKGGMMESKIAQVLESLAKNCTPPFEPQEIPIKIKSAMDRSERKERHWQNEVYEWVAVTKGYWCVTESYSELQAVTKQDKAAIRQAIHRLTKEGMLERDEKRNAWYRSVDQQCEEIDFMSAEDNHIDLKFPLGLEQYAKIMPKNIVVVSGSSNAGKTAFFLSFTEMNMEKHKINYFSSEMGALEMKSRLAMFDRDLSSWKFTPLERASNFADVIKPEEINIIDFLEVTDEFYKVGGFIKEIFDKLTTGIAIIGLQKNSGKQVKLGRGGNMSLEKPRLYLSMDFNRLEIVKCKNWADQRVNPNGRFIDFRLDRGCEFTATSDWSFEQ